MDESYYQQLFFFGIGWAVDKIKTTRLHYTAVKNDAGYPDRYTY